MSKKIVIFLIIIFILPLIIGGFLLKAGILENSSFLASLIRFKSPSVLSQSDVLLLKEKIQFLEEELEAKEFDLEYLDDLIEENDLLSQRIIGLKDEIQVLYESIFEYENNKEDEELNDELEEEDGEENEEKLQINLCEIIPGTLPIKNKVIINEVAWMGSLNSANDEWIELKNISGAEINLSGWQLQDKAQQIKIIFNEKDIISASSPTNFGFISKLVGDNGFYFLEKGSDQAVPGISADKIYTGVLSNENENLYFFDESCRLQDEAEANPNWPAGDNSSKRTMERKSDLAWQTSLNFGGTPKAENSSGYAAVSFVAARGDGGGASTPAKIFYPKVLISEVQISPIGERFIELYNPNDTDVDLTGWYIQRKTGSAWNSLVSSTYFNGKFIPAKGYFLITKNAEFNPDIILSTLTLMENNAIVLKNPNQEEVDKVGWGQAPDFEGAPADCLDFDKCPPDGKSLGRIWDNENQTYFDTDNNLNDFEIQEPSPCVKNIPLEPPLLPPPPEPDADTMAPTIAFDIATIQTTLNFNINFTITDLSVENVVTPSGVASYIFRWQEGGSSADGWQEDLPVEVNRGLTPVNLTREFTDGEDGKTYYFQINATDVAGNESGWLPIDPVLTKIEIPPPVEVKPIVINEIQIEGETTKDEFVELFNSNEFGVDLAGFSLKKKTSGGNESNLVSSSKFSGVISALGYFLIVPQINDDETLNYTGSATPDLYYSGKIYSIAGNNTILLYDKNENLQDRVGFGGAQDFETSPALIPPAGQSITRTGGVDANDNSVDFVISETPTPKTE